MDGALKIAQRSNLADNHGRLRHQVGTTTFDGNPADFTLPTHQRWHLYAIRFSYACSAVLGTRRLRIEIRSGATVIQRTEAQLTQIANQTRSYTATPATRDSAAFINNEAQIRLPPNLYLSPGQTVRIAVTAGRLDDSIENPEYTLEDWIDG